MFTRLELHEALVARHGAENQARLESARVAVCGLGGLGSNVAIALARAGVGALHLFDFDCVELSNLNRQQYFPRQLGRPKTEALAETLSEIAPYCQISATTVRLTEENIPSLLAGFPIICEAFDRAEAKATLVNTVLTAFPDTWLVAGNGMAGLGEGNLIQTRQVGKRLILCGDGISGVESGAPLFSARVLLCAAHQALAILRLITQTNIN